MQDNQEVYQQQQTNNSQDISKPRVIEQTNANVSVPLQKNPYKSAENKMMSLGVILFIISSIITVLYVFSTSIVIDHLTSYF